MVEGNTEGNECSKVAFKILDEDERPPIGSQHMKCHMVLSIKMEDFSRKAHLVEGGHIVEALKSLTYASMVSRESVRIALTLAALNDVEVKTLDIQSAYLTAPCSEKVHNTLGMEFGENRAKTAIIIRALYGLALSGASFRNHLTDCMHHIGYKSCLADPDLWYKPAVREEDKFKYCSYVDDCLCIPHSAEEEFNKIDKFFKMKAGSIGDPDIYLGAKIKPMKMNSGVTAWAISPSEYVNTAVNNCEKWIQENMPEHKHNSRASNPFQTDYDPDLDRTAELDEEEATYYQSQIGILCWIVELGRINIATEVSLLASHVALPRKGHLQTVFHISAYLKKGHNSRLALDPSYPEIDMRVFHHADWTDCYGQDITNDNCSLLRLQQYMTIQETHHRDPKQLLPE